jgi:hypothetical protein
MPTKRLPANPDIRHLQLQVKDLLKGRTAADPAVLQRIREFHPRFADASDASIRSAAFTTADSYFTVAREYGFSSWARLRTAIGAGAGADATKPHHERIRDAAFREAVDLIDDGDGAALREHLRKHPRLVHERVSFEGENYFTHPSLLEFVAENPVRNGTLPPNAAEIAEIIVDAGAEPIAISETLMLVSSGSVSRECGLQLPLIELLCSRGAVVDGAIIPALVHGELEAAEALLRRGATMDVAVAAGLGRVEVVRELLPASKSSSRQMALALAAQQGHAAIVTALLDAGEDPNRYNPVGGHSHSTPLHQAAIAGHLEVVRTLIEHGARVDMRDALFDGTAMDWAVYGKQDRVVAYLNGK